MMLRDFFVGIFVCTTFCFLVGCSPNSKVTGKVTFEDGSPLTVGEVIFESETLQARGTIDTSGKYTMGTIKEKDGVPLGKYRVYIGGAAEPTGNMIPYGGGRDSTATRPEMRPLIGSKFFLPASSGLTCDVNGPTVFDITVTKPD